MSHVGLLHGVFMAPVLVQLQEELQEELPESM
jgi:hypothetical protein